jgi:hypothetical protein
MDIYKTDTETLRNEIKELKKKMNENVYSEYILKQIAPNLYKTSKTLFDMIIKNKSGGHNTDQTIEKMLDLISEIQNKKISQYDASGIIGTQLAEQYIDVMK